MSNTQVNFYAHVSENTFEIQKITTNAAADNGHIAFVIEDELAKKFLTGEYIPHQWIAGRVEENFELRRKRDKKLIVNRIDTSPITAVAILDLGNKPEVDAIFGNEVAIVIDTETQIAKLYYDGDAFVKNRSVNLYFTREGDPSQLLSTFLLNFDVLDELKVKYNLQQWPNPIILKLNCNRDGFDLSIFSQKNGATVAAYVRKPK